MPIISTVGLVCCDKFKETPNKKVGGAWNFLVNLGKIEIKFFLGILGKTESFYLGNLGKTELFCLGNLGKKITYPGN